MALFSCFGLLNPRTPYYAFGAAFVRYRIWAFKLIEVFRRPIPNAACGEESFLSYFQIICHMALMLNGLILFQVFYSNADELRYAYSFLLLTFPCSFLAR